jgi:hypothetical protein
MHGDRAWHILAAAMTGFLAGAPRLECPSWLRSAALEHHADAEAQESLINDTMASLRAFLSRSSRTRTPSDVGQ